MTPSLRREREGGECVCLVLAQPWYYGYRPRGCQRPADRNRCSQTVFDPPIRQEIDYRDRVQALVALALVVSIWLE